MVQVTSFAANRIFDQREKGRVIKLGDLWAEKPVLLLFLRRLGCAICRNYAQKIQTALPELKGIQVVALTFENLGEDSDKDGSFSKGGFWTGPLYKIDKSVYHYLFGKKSIFGILDIDKESLKQVRENKIPGNFKGDGLTLGGQMLVAPPDRVLLDKRQTRFGDDATLEEILEAINACD
jgi:hypothetical protein